MLMPEQGVTVMHQNRYWIFAVGMAVFGLGGVLAMQAAPRYPACAEIRAACKQAGFERGRAKTGEGIFVDCIAPIMRRAPQPRRASKPLPQNQPRDAQIFVGNVKAGIVGSRCYAASTCSSIFFAGPYLLA